MSETEANATPATRSGDPTHGRIDPDIQQLVDEMEPKSLGQRVAMQNTLQARRDLSRTGHPRYAFTTSSGTFRTEWAIVRLRDDKRVHTGRKWLRNHGVRAWDEMTRVAERYGYA